MLIGQDGEDLAFSIRMRATILKLRNPTISLKDGMPGELGDTVDAAGALHDGAFELSTRNGERLLVRHLPLSASWGWSLVLPWDYSFGPNEFLLTALWIAGLVGVLTYLSSLAGGAAVTLPPLTTLMLLALVPHAADLPPAHWSEWMAALAGICIGWAFAVAARSAMARNEGTE